MQDRQREQGGPSRVQSPIKSRQQILSDLQDRYRSNAGGPTRVVDLIRNGQLTAEEALNAGLISPDLLHRALGEEFSQCVDPSVSRPDQSVDPSLSMKAPMEQEDGTVVDGSTF